MNKTKIIATIGPATESHEMLSSLCHAGMNIARLNFSHGTHQWYETVIKTIKDLKSSPSIMLDTKGPEVRSANKTACHLKAGVSYTLGHKSNQSVDIPISLQHIQNKVSLGGSILLDGGKIVCSVERICKDHIIIYCASGGVLETNKHVNIPGVALGLPVLSAADKSDLAFGIAHGIHMVAASFINSGEDIGTIRREIRKHTTKYIPIIAKIETQLALLHIDEVLAASDGIMVARGDLGMEAGIIKLPEIERLLIKKAREVGKPVIVATQMLASMVNNPTPSRAEVMDVSTAVMLGSDAVMLSEETSVGNFPVESVQFMHDLCNESESSMVRSIYNGKFSSIIQMGVRHGEDMEQEPHIILFTNSTPGVLHLASTRTGLNTLIFTEDEGIYHTAMLLYGLQPHLLSKGMVDTITGSQKEMMKFTDQLVKDSILKKGDNLITFYDLVGQDKVLDTMQVTHA